MYLIPLYEVATTLLILLQGCNTNLLDAPMTFKIFSRVFSALISEVKLLVCIAVHNFKASALFP